MRKMFLFASLLAGTIALSGCFGSLKTAQDDAAKLATAFHSQMTQGDLAGIYNNADQRYRDAVTRTKSDALFSSIARKLGSPLDCKPGGFNVNMTTSGTILKSQCETRFSKDATAVETFTWVKSTDQYRLLGYNINSDALIER
jgi:urocanate hydratase